MTPCCPLAHTVAGGSCRGGGRMGALEQSVRVRTGACFRRCGTNALGLDPIHHTRCRAGGRGHAQPNARARSPRVLEPRPVAITRNHFVGFTRRENEVAELLCQGLSNAAIASRLHRSERTVGHTLQTCWRNSTSRRARRRCSSCRIFDKPQKTEWRDASKRDPRTELRSPPPRRRPHASADLARASIRRGRRTGWRRFPWCCRCP